MIFGYFDESGESGDGHYVLAGFVGRRKDWKNYSRLWTEAKGGQGPLHMKDLRLGSKTGLRRYSPLLEKLGPIPKQSGLHAFAGSVRTSDYADTVRGTIAQLTMSGYNVALVCLIDNILESNKLPKRERIEFTFEEQTEFAQLRAQDFNRFRRLERYRAHHGLSRIAGDRSIAKDLMLEASDYLAYAILQYLVDPESDKSKATQSMLLASWPDHTQVTKENASFLINTVYGTDLSTIPKMDKNKKSYLLSRMNEFYGPPGQGRPPKRPG